MKYSIISINDKRYHYKHMIRTLVGCSEEIVASVDGAYIHKQKDIKLHLEDLGLKLTSPWPLSLGEIGVWISNYLRWERVGGMDEPLIVFEDDAVVREDFDTKLSLLMRQLPSDWDFLSLWVPDNQRIDYRYDVHYNSNGDPQILGVFPEYRQSYYDCGQPDIARAYQGYGMVATVYSPQGGKKLVELTKEHGLRNPVDCFLFQEAHKGALNGYAPKPDKVFVDYDWPETQIHNTEKYK